MKIVTCSCVSRHPGTREGNQTSAPSCASELCWSTLRKWRTSRGWRHSQEAECQIFSELQTPPTPWRWVMIRQTHDRIQLWQDTLPNVHPSSFFPSTVAIKIRGMYTCHHNKKNQIGFPKPAPQLPVFCTARQCNIWLTFVAFFWSFPCAFVAYIAEKCFLRPYMLPT